MKTYRFELIFNQHLNNHTTLTKAIGIRLQDSLDQRPATKIRPQNPLQICTATHTVNMS